MSYESLRTSPVPNTECHHLISRAALNRWRYYLKGKGIKVPEWLDDDLQNWGPAIRISKTHHAKTASYYNPDKMDAQALSKAGQYITDQSELLIKGKIQACFDMEIEILPKVIKDKYPTEIEAAKTYFKEFLENHELPAAAPDSAPSSPTPSEYATKEYVDEELDEIRGDIGKILNYIQNHL